ncbi:hypothetical protein KIPB_006910 [Kipferlia bialata]|uniref:Uncharacterized protein n=1 Tax=Kipferlia bialata TaxID=797122 RepID=A0A9K3GK58_9EUKA|nr:hypothetical protein KIPB_006910 [Kipferlia bialata]|eukprot:g6910.t1
MHILSLDTREWKHERLPDALRSPIGERSMPRVSHRNTWHSPFALNGQLYTLYRGNHVNGSESDPYTLQVLRDRRTGRADDSEDFPVAALVGSWVNWLESTQEYGDISGHQQLIRINPLTLLSDGCGCNETHILHISPERLYPSWSLLWATVRQSERVVYNTHTDFPLWTIEEERDYLDEVMRPNYDPNHGPPKERWTGDTSCSIQTRARTANWTAKVRLSGTVRGCLG